jgi:RNA polymerase sigma factor for flagellar operon FliA
MSTADPTPLPADAIVESRLWERLVRERDAATRNALIEMHLPLCRTIAASLYARRGGLEVEFLDYMQLATLGLIEAVDRFDPALGFKFATFASPRIRGSILNNLEPMSERYTQVSLRKRIQAEWLESLNPPDPAGGKRRKRDLLSSLADLTIGLALCHLLEGSGMLAGEDGERSYRQEFYDNQAKRQLTEALAKLVRALPDQERRVIQYHYYHGLDFTEIAGLLELSKGRISQIHRQALQLVREAYASLGGLQLLL